MFVPPKPGITPIDNSCKPSCAFGVEMRAWHTCEQGRIFHKQCERILLDRHHKQEEPIIIFCDNISTITMIKSNVP